MSLLQMSFAGAVIIVIRALAITFLPKKTFLALWGIAVMRLLLPFSLPSVFSVYSLIGNHIPMTAPAKVQQAFEVLPPEISGQMATMPGGISNTASPISVWTIIWGIGALVCALVFAIAYWKCRREFQTSLPVDNDFIKGWLSSHQLKREISIRQSSRFSVPLTYGVLRPVILTPTSTDWENTKALQYVFAHEYVHIRRFDSLRIEGDDGSYRYAQVTGSSTAMSFKVRVFTYTYFQYRYGFEPSFIFGTNNFGQDIITRLAGAARFSLLLALSVSVINLVIGAIYGAIEGYYGGAVDIVMERISDILSGVPFMVVTTLFQLHLAQKVGVVPALLFAFVTTGWIGMASSTRMQFYRYKNQEYILAARTLGASDARLMFKHIFPNALGTLITSAVLVIPGVIFSESTLTYLGIVNLDSSTMSSIGSMLSSGQSSLTTYPHIILFPAIYISLLEISFNLFGNGLRDAFNPSLRGTED